MSYLTEVFENATYDLRRSLRHYRRRWDRMRLKQRSRELSRLDGWIFDRNINRLEHHNLALHYLSLNDSQQRQHRRKMLREESQGLPKYVIGFLVSDIIVVLLPLLILPAEQAVIMGFGMASVMPAATLLVAISPYLVVWRLERHARRICRNFQKELKIFEQKV